MIYRLKSAYALRGWEKMTGTVVKRPENKVRPISSEKLQVLMLCDGQTDLDQCGLDTQLQSVLEQCEADGIIERCSSPHPLEPDQYYRYYHNRFVESVFWSITGRCNYRCRHCYMDAPDAALGEISTAEALDFIDQMAECGVLSVDITGGEPLVRKDFWQLMDRILAHKMRIGTFYTNGWLLNESVLDEFERRGMRPEISLSFDGVGWHDWMRGGPGAEQAALRALELCRQRGFSTDAEMCLHGGNRDTLQPTIEALCSVGVSRLRVGTVTMTDLWKKHNEGHTLTEEEYIETALAYIPVYYKTRPPLDLMLGGIVTLKRDGSYKVLAQRYDGTERCLDCHLCGGTRWSCYITGEGRLLPCMPMTASPDQSKFPKVQEIGLQQGLSDSCYMQFVDRRVKDLMAANPECAACDYRYKCGGGCRAAALTGPDHNLMGCDRDMCFLWKKGYAERIQQAVEDAKAKYGASSAE